MQAKYTEKNEEENSLFLTWRRYLTGHPGLFILQDDVGNRITHSKGFALTAISKGKVSNEMSLELVDKCLDNQRFDLFALSFPLAKLSASTETSTTSAWVPFTQWSPQHS